MEEKPLTYIFFLGGIFWASLGLTPYFNNYYSESWIVFWLVGLLVCLLAIYIIFKIEGKRIEKGVAGSPIAFVFLGIVIVGISILIFRKSIDYLINGILSGYGLVPVAVFFLLYGVRFCWIYANPFWRFVCFLLILMFGVKLLLFSV